MKSTKTITARQLERFPVYLKILYDLKGEGVEIISGSALAKKLKYSEEQVRKDLQVIATKVGKPGSGRKIDQLIADFENFLGYNDMTTAVIVGVGSIGKAFLNYEGFANFGLKILAGFDINPDLIGKSINGAEIHSIEEMETIIPKLGVKIGILTVPKEVGLEMANKLVECGITGIWNFVPIHLTLKEGIVIENVDLSASLAMLSHRMKN